MTTPTTTDRETVLGILRELRDEMRTEAQDKTTALKGVAADDENAPWYQGAADAFEDAADIIGERIDAIEREEHK